VVNLLDYFQTFVLPCMYFHDKFALQFITMQSDFDLRKPIDRILGFLKAHLSESLGERGHDRVLKVPMNTTQVRSVQKVVKVAYKMFEIDLLFNLLALGACRYRCQTSSSRPGHFA
jgi:hypothetical protein